MTVAKSQLDRESSIGNRGRNFVKHSPAGYTKGGVELRSQSGTKKLGEKRERGLAKGVPRPGAT